MRILVCGGRNYGDVHHLYKTLDKVKEKYPDFRLIHGDAKGADRLAADWAFNRIVEDEAHPADWETHGKRAGPLRNQEMLDSGVDAVIAFPGGRGTAHMVRIAKEAGVPVWEVAKTRSRT